MDALSDLLSGLVILLNRQKSIILRNVKDGVRDYDAATVGQVKGKDKWNFHVITLSSTPYGDGGTLNNDGSISQKEDDAGSFSGIQLLFDRRSYDGELSVVIGGAFPQQPVAEGIHRNRFIHRLPPGRSN